MPLKVSFNNCSVYTLGLDFFTEKAEKKLRRSKFLQTTAFEFLFFCCESVNIEPAVSARFLECHNIFYAAEMGDIAHVSI